MYSTVDQIKSHRISMQNALDVIRWRTGLDVTLAANRLQWRMELANWRGDVCMNMRDVWTVEDMENVIREFEWLAFMEAN